jgi:hypothetical protein
MCRARFESDDRIYARSAQAARGARVGARVYRGSVTDTAGPSASTAPAGVGVGISP